MADTQRVWGGDSESQINQVNQWMRSQPWYTDYLASIGQDPENTHLSKSQSQQLLKLAQANGAVVDEGKIEVDPSGNFNPKGHKLRNTLIGAGLAGGAILAAPALAGLGAAGAAGSGTAVPALGGGATLAADLGGAGALGAAGTGGTLATLGGGATLASNLGGASAVGGSVAPVAGAGGAGVLASTPTASSYMVPVAGSAGLTSAGAAGGGSAASRIFDRLVGKTAEDRIATGANLLGNYLQSRQASKATQAEIDAANKALDLQRNVYLQQRADLGPFADVGRGAVSDLARMTGTRPAASTTLPAFQPNVTPTMVGPNGSPAPHDGNPNNAPVVGQAVLRNPNTLATLGGTGFVNMLSPDGRPARVPQAQVNAALQAGGRMA